MVTFIDAGILGIFTVLFITLCIMYGVHSAALEARAEGVREYFATVIVVYLLFLAFEGGLLVLLFMASKQRSFNKSRVWFVINAIVLVLSVISFIVEAFAGWPKSGVVTILEIIYEGICLKIMYDFMMEIRITPDGDVPFQEMKNETV